MKIRMKIFCSYVIVLALLMIGISVGKKISVAYASPFQKIERIMKK